MSELLQLRGGERVLEVGTGSGYQAAVLGELASSQELLLCVKTAQGLLRKSVIPVRFVPLTGDEVQKRGRRRGSGQAN